MKFREVTWYSKILALIFFIALPFIGFYAGMRYQEATSPSGEVTNGNGTIQDGWETVVENDQIAVKTKYEGGKLKYTGTVQVPSACYRPKVDTIVLESYPKQVQIRVSLLETKTVCAQVITDKPFSGEIEASEDAVVSIYLDDQKVE